MYVISHFWYSKSNMTASKQFTRYYTINIQGNMLKSITYTPLTNSPIILALLVKAMVGIVANGSCRLMTAFKKSFIPVRLSMSK